MHFGFALPALFRHIGKRSRLRVECLPHHVDAENVIAKVGGFPRGNLDFLEGLEYGDVIVAPQELRRHFVGEDGFQQVDGHDATFAIRLHTAFAA